MADDTVVTPSQNAASTSSAAGPLPLPEPVEGNIDRRGRSVQVDGFLVEWKRADARPWNRTGWEWDAIITPGGIAGYFRPGETPACSAWTFDISPKEEALATGYENNAAEWLISDVNTKKITVKATSECGDTLPVLVLTVNPPEVSTKMPAILYMVITMALAAVLTLILTLRKRGPLRSTA